MSETAAALTESAPAPAASSAPAAAPQADGAAPAPDAAAFIPDTPESEAAPAEAGKAEEGKGEPKPQGEGKDFLAETDDDKANGEADGPADAKQDGASEAYQPFVLPDGVTLDDATLAKATPVFRKLSLDQAGAQELVSLYAQITQDSLQSYHDVLAQGHAQTLKQWTDATKSDPTFGQDNLAASKANAMRALALRPEAKAVLVEYGLDRNPHVFALLASVGAKLSDDSLVREDAGAAVKAAPQRVADVMYT